MAVCRKMCCDNGVKNDTSPLVPKKGTTNPNISASGHYAPLISQTAPNQNHKLHFRSQPESSDLWLPSPGLPRKPPLGAGPGTRRLVPAREPQVVQGNTR